MVVETLACAESAQALDAHERARAYEIAAYLSAASFPFDVPDGPPAIPIPNTDIALNALVQHGVHKMECDRAFLSFIDNRSQFICAEMTRNQSIVDVSPAEPLLLGATRIPLEWGVCPYTMSVFHGRKAALPVSPHIVASENFFYIEDFRRIPLFAARPFVAGYPHMVSYIEVPLRSLSGHILGSYCVVDDKLRNFLEPSALRTIQEVTSAISKYLDMKRVEEGRVRSERMMNGLRQFVGFHDPTSSEGGTSKSPFSLDIFEERAHKDFEFRVGQNTECDPVQKVTLDGRSMLEGRTDYFQCLAKSEAFLEALPNSSTNPMSDVYKTSTISSQNDKASKESPPSLSGRIGELFPKAANLIGHAMDLDGLVLFDAVETGTRYRAKRSSSITEDEFARPDNLSAQPLSEYLRDATAEQNMVRWPSHALMQRLIAAYPRGRVFTIDEYGVFGQEAQKTESSEGSSSITADHKEWEELFDCIPKARYALFLPLWHYQRESCFSTCLAWMSEPGKTLEMTDLNSLTAFGNSLMAELFRLEAATSTQQKSDFISSVSHELRSPLHGILATVELMQEDLEDARLLSLTHMIESCSYTLLDTFDHLLEFSKINSHRGTKQAARAKFTAGDAPTNNMKIHLGSIVEDVLEAAVLGHTSALHLGAGLKKEHQASLANEVEGAPLPALITTSIEHNSDLTSHMDPGAWKRILLNILSNALRFTESGNIDVTLKILEETDTRSQCISLSVTDTGVGMSPEFLKYHLFTPFMQENSLNSGTGLGLNIVKSIVESLDGKIFVDSRQHMGTRITVNLPFSKDVETSHQAEAMGSFAADDKTRNLTIGIISIAPRDALDDRPALQIVPLPKLLQRSLRNICENHLNMTVADDSPFGNLLKKDIVLIDTHALSFVQMLDLRTQFPELVSAMGSRPTIVLGPTTEGVARFFTHEGATFISSPITRKSLRVAIVAAMNKIVSTGTMPPQPSRHTEMLFPGPSDDEPPFTQRERASLPVRNAPSQTGSGEKRDSLSPINQKTYPAKEMSHTSVANSLDPRAQYRFRRLLLVDDNPINLKLLATFIKRTGLSFAIACDGAEAVRLYKKSVEEEVDPFDCVFMDISMPIMDGFQATVAIRQFEVARWKKHRDCDANASEMEGLGANDNEQQEPALSEARRSHIFALTGLGSEEARNKALDSGMDLFLMKPLKFKSIEPLLRAVPVNSEL